MSFMQKTYTVLFYVKNIKCDIYNISQFLLNFWSDTVNRAEDIQKTLKDLADPKFLNGVYILKWEKCRY